LLVLAVGFFIMTLDNEQYGLGFLGITLRPVDRDGRLYNRAVRDHGERQKHENTQEK
jgi:hypothetical protein